MSQPLAPRQGAGSFPPYRYVPGRSPHPRRDPLGHSYGRPEPRAARLDPEAFRSSALYLQALDLYNAGYWWEAHELLEALWHGAGRQGREARFFQGLIQLAAASLKRLTDPEGGGRALARRGLDRLASCPSPYFGLDVARVVEHGEAHFFGAREEAPQLFLLGP